MHVAFIQAPKTTSIDSYAAVSSCTMRLAVVLEYVRVAFEPQEDSSEPQRKTACLYNHVHLLLWP